MIRPLLEASLADLVHVCAHARPRDVLELSALFPGDWNPAGFAEMVYRSSTKGWLAYHEGVPAAAIGYSIAWTGVANLWAFGTESWPLVVKPLTRHVKKVMFPELAGMGVHRLQALALAGREDADRFIRFFGATLESEMKAIGKNREDFRMYRLLSHEYAHPAS